MKLKSNDDVAVDWPLTLEEMRRTSRGSRSSLASQGRAHYPWDPGRKYPLPPLPLNSSAVYMAIGCEAMGFALRTRPLQQCRGRTRGRSMARAMPAQIAATATRVAAMVRRQAWMSHMPAVLNAGAEIREECFVHGVERDTQGQITAVLYTDENGAEKRQKTANVSMCGWRGNSAAVAALGYRQFQRSGVTQFHGAYSTQVWATMNAETRPYKGFPASLISEDFMRAKGVDYAGGYLLQSYGILPLAWAEQVVRARNLVGQALVVYLSRYNNVAGMGMNGDTLPNPENRLTLSGEKDRRGLPKPLITFSLSDNEKKMSDHAEGNMRRILMAAGGKDLWSSQRTAHTVGTCRMGTAADNSVVDRFGRSWDMPNLYIADNSVFPTSLAANPALTIMALSLRTADAFLQQR